MLINTASARYDNNTSNIKRRSFKASIHPPIVCKVYKHEKLNRLMKKANKMKMK